jgi:hypothetical protein
LNCPVFDKIFLKRVKVFRRPEALDGGNFLAIRLADEDHAGIDGVAIEKNRATPAIPLFTPVLDFGKTQIPQGSKEGEVRGKIALDLFPVDFECHGYPFHRKTSWKS